MIRFFAYLAVALIFIWFGSTAKLGSRTLFGHVKAVWATEEAQEMKRGVEQSAKPMVDKVKRGVEAGYREATRDASPTAEPGDDAPKAEREATGDDAPTPLRTERPKKRHHHP